IACGVRGSGFPHVLAATQVYGNVIRALREQGHKHGLAVRIAAIADSKGTPASQATFFLRGEPVCRLRVEGVRRIARVAIVVDDLGGNLAAVRAVLRLHAPLTLSVMPRLPYSRETAEQAHHAGAEVMLHLPMQPLADSAPDVSPDEIRSGMNGAEVSRIVDQDLASVPGAAGVNNHMGSRATADRKLMAEVMKALVGRHLYFVDSRTSPDSVAFAEARRNGLPAFYRSIFLDDTRTVSYALKQLRALCRMAQDRGAALAIGHPYPSTLAALRGFLPQLERDQVQLVPVSQIIRLREAARLAPPAQSPARKR
ncbi:MAG TPA: divergent polysaccharide deacetylase family protein, partial [Terriglobia bacterium]|nr:divergent polysaccharide deacetylase family protein [Terriglobia bacterium]